MPDRSIMHQKPPVPNAYSPVINDETMSALYLKFGTVKRQRGSDVIVEWDNGAGGKYARKINTDTLSSTVASLDGHGRGGRRGGRRRGRKPQAA